jgi:hypothetical protein
MFEIPALLARDLQPPGCQPCRRPEHVSWALEGVGQVPHACMDMKDT